MRAQNRRAALLTALTVLGSAAMIWVEQVLRPAYVEKSLLKLAVFLGCILLGRLTGGLTLGLKKPEGRALAWGGILAALVFGVILMGYLALSPWLDLSHVTASLEEKERITAAAFPLAAAYISLVNSFLEELFFRGFAFLCLREHIGERRALWISALAFSVYHVGILDGWTAPAVVALALAGLFGAGALFALLDRRGSILPSWLVHIAANLAINAVGLRLFGIW